jgi:glutamate synthase (ferredoxin)
VAKYQRRALLNRYPKDFKGFFMTSMQNCFPEVVEHDACGVGFIYRPAAGHDVVFLALSALAAMEHRGACGADGESGDGAGILTAIPWLLFEKDGWKRESYSAVGVVYLPRGEEEHCKFQTGEILKEFGLEVVGWRSVPVDESVLGRLARATCPSMVHVFVRLQEAEERDDNPNGEGDSTAGKRSAELSLSVSKSPDQETIERLLMAARKKLINQVRTHEGCQEFYLPSLSTRTIVYKGMVKSAVLRDFYEDLRNRNFQSNFAIFHRRFSTNTYPRWALAQPFRMLAHNGEINTLLGNRNWMRAREPHLEHPIWLGRPAEQQPVIYRQGSDSGSLDNALEMMIRADCSAEKALMQLMPEAYQNQPDLKEFPEILDFYRYYEPLQEPWDGPAMVVYSDGRSLGAILDRNGLRPARFTIFTDGSIILSSETGVISPLGPVAEKGRLGPGQLISVDLESGQIRRNYEVKSAVARQHPYGNWITAERSSLSSESFLRSPEYDTDTLRRVQTAFGCGKEEVEQVITVMAKTAAEPIYSMGDDAPLAVLSDKPRVLYDYFKQRFAQVTNPAIDPLRERLVMSLDSYLGRRFNLLRPEALGARILHLKSPILNERELSEVAELGGSERFRTVRLVLESESDLGTALEKICAQSLAAVRDGADLLLLSDRDCLTASTACVPVLLAVAAVHHHLIRNDCRLDCSIIVETGQCWSTHHFACLIGFGAQAICPYLALESVRHLCKDSQGKFQQTMIALDVDQAQSNYVESVEHGILKVLSKMGISALVSYVGAQIFECIGLGPLVIAQCFEGTVSRIGGLELPDIEKEVRQFHALAFVGELENVPDFGFLKHRQGGEFHGNNPEVVRALHSALDLRKAPEQEKHKSFQDYSALIKSRRPSALRDLLEFAPPERSPVTLSEVEPVEHILSRFCTGGMSLGALSKEAHEILAVAMNRIGGKSNSGEGGEDPVRYYPMRNVKADGTCDDFPGLQRLRTGDSASSAIRQVASARFGVTPEYLRTARQLEIKIAQGAKPGEGGQLPAHKVSPYIASLRRAKPAMPLISPPPHHDIYSIEDLAQLIYDLKQINPDAFISVKLVSQVGIGTVAAGVAKANADVIQISGHDGGTGAAPLSSIKHTGAPWELGLAESHQVLVANELRNKVRLRVDGGLKTGWEVVLAAMLGAYEFGFGSIALIAEGCIMARVCHTNNCPVGITSQKEALRKKLKGSPDSVVEFFLFLAEEVRLTLASLGYRSLEEVIGRADRLRVKEGVHLSKLSNLDLGSLLAFPKQCNIEWMNPSLMPNPNAITLDDSLLADNKMMTAVNEHGSFSRSCLIGNTDRAVGTKLCGELVARWGDNGFRGCISLDFYGSAGQSFGAFNVANVRLSLTGDANDYVGKGMNGGVISIKPGPDVESRSWRNVLLGNTCLYGATGGELFAAGLAGERFAVRNSGATAVVEGVGDHGCEYMTAGTVVVLGAVGRNFGAGMTGGIAFVLDLDQTFALKLNPDEGKVYYRLNSLTERIVHDLVQKHYDSTSSVRAREILEQWPRYAEQFWIVLPPAEFQQLQLITEAQNAVIDLKEESEPQVHEVA